MVKLSIYNQYVPIKDSFKIVLLMFMLNRSMLFIYRYIKISNTTRKDLENRYTYTVVQYMSINIYIYI